MRVGPGAVEVVGHHQTQDRIPQELQPLVAGQAPPMLVGIGAVGQGVLQQSPVPKGIADLFFQCFHPDPPFQQTNPRHGTGDRISRRSRSDIQLTLEIVDQVAHGLDGRQVLFAHLADVKLLFQGHG